MAQEGNRLERVLVGHCAPTLSGMKAGSLFCYCGARENADSLHRQAGCIRARLESAGFGLARMGEQRNGALFYVYSPHQLERDWQDGRSRTYLQQLGYDCDDVEKSVALLSERIRYANGRTGCAKRMDFPHEVGLFLGYPFHDVMGFIKNRGENYIAFGCWKVYEQERETLRRFRTFKLCTERLVGMAEDGAGLDEVIAAAQSAA